MKLLFTKISILYLWTLLFLAFLPGIAAAADSENPQDEPLDLDNFEDFEDILQEESPEETLSPETIIRIENITVILDGEIYVNPVQNANLEKRKTKFEVLFSEIPLRQGDFLSKRRFDKILAAAAIRLSQGAYYGNVKFEYALDEKGPSAENLRPITLYVSVEQSHPFLYFGGNAYASLGYKMPNGVVSKYYAGANRVEAIFDKKSILFQREDGTFSRTPLIAGGRAFGYWNYLSPWSRTFLYGGSAKIGLRPIPDLHLTLEAQAVGASTYKEKIPTEDIESMGLPPADSTGLSFGGILRLNHRWAFRQVGYYRPHIEFSIPLSMGYWTGNLGEKPFEFYDSYGFLGSMQFAYSLFLDQALTLRGGYITNGLSDSLPYHAKVNLQSGFFNNYGLEDRISRLGSGYEQHLYLGNKGAFLSLEYGITLLRVSIIALEFYGFYQMGTVADEFDKLTANLRHTVGPGIGLFFDRPVNLKASFEIGFGGDLIPNQSDGKPVSIGFSVTMF